MRLCYVREMYKTLLDPCVAPVVEPSASIDTLASTGLDGTTLIIVTVLAAVILATGVVAFLKAGTLRGKLTVFLIPALLLGTLAFNSPQSASATTGAPTVASEAVITFTYGVPTFDMDTAEITSEATFINPENCGVLTYQWQTNTYIAGEGPFLNNGVVLTSADPLIVPDCDFYRAQLLTTLTNGSGSITSTSNSVSICD